MAPRLRLSPPKKERRSLLFDEPKRTRSPGPILSLVVALSLGVLLFLLLTQSPASTRTSSSWMMLQWNMIDTATTGRQLSPYTSYKTASGTAATETEPGVVWLMSFPNSGTSFTIHMTREATNCTTATNYGLEGEIKDAPSVPALSGPRGSNGPWLELIPNRHTRIPRLLLTKTHCKAFCSGAYCGAEKTFHTVRSFMTGCLTGNQGVLVGKEGGGLQLTDTTYDPSIVQKAIHLFRHPLDNIVARFHLEFNEKRDAGDTRYTQMFPKNATGFHRWCAMDDRNRALIQSHLIDRKLRSLMMNIPCLNEFYRYGQWHNLAFATTQAMNVTTMVLHYHEYSQDLATARAKVLQFLEVPRVGEGIQFHEGKVYRNYYTAAQRQAIRVFLEELSIAETWKQLQGYDFDTNTSPEPGSIDIELKKKWMKKKQ